MKSRRQTLVTIFSTLGLTALFTYGALWFSDQGKADVRFIVSTPERKASAWDAKMRSGDGPYGFSKMESMDGAAMECFASMDSNVPFDSTNEALIAIVALHERFGPHYLYGYQISSYAFRYTSAKAAITDHLLRSSSAAHREKVKAIRKTLRRLMDAEIEFATYLNIGTGTAREIAMEWCEVERVFSEWAVRTDGVSGVPRAGSTNPFQRHIDAIRKDDPGRYVRFDPGEHLNEGRLTTKANGEAIIRVLNQLADELSAWPPEAAEELSDLILKSI